MVKKGLKPGDTFVDGGRTYKVLSVCSNGNYISKEYQESEEVPEQESEGQKDSETVQEPEVVSDESKNDKPVKPKGTRKTGR